MGILDIFWLLIVDIDLIKMVNSKPLRVNTMVFSIAYMEGYIIMSINILTTIYAIYM
jgi:hypothetical protein